MDSFFSGYGTNEKMVVSTIMHRGIRDSSIVGAFLRTDRVHFVPDSFRELAYEDGPLSIGHGQTISQPYIVALMTELLEPGKDRKVLEIGTGSGYQTAILSEVFGEVYTVERIKKLSDKASRLLEKLGYMNVSFRVGDGFKGWPEYKPYDGIIVTASPEEAPEALLKQLSDGGRMVIPIGRSGGIQVLYRITRQKDRYLREEICDVRFVPMISGME